MRTIIAVNAFNQNGHCLSLEEAVVLLYDCVLDRREGETNRDYAFLFSI